jgi:hypothetical protein
LGPLFKVGGDSFEAFSQPSMSGVGRVTRMPVHCFVNVWQGKWGFQGADMGCLRETPGSSFQDEADK